MVSEADLHAACLAGDVEAVRQLLAAGIPAYSQDEEDGVSVLMRAAGAGQGEIVSMLLGAGAPWNALDRQGCCAGNHALEAGHQLIVDALVDAAVREELLLGAAERGTQKAAAVAAESTEYLSRGVRYEGDTLFDEANDAVMMEWERPLMEAHAERLCASGGDVLNVGFGMGIIDGAIQRRNPRSHTIIEAHPGVIARMKANGWHAKPNVRVCQGRWQECVQQLIDEGVQFDGIFFDTYGEHSSDMQDFHDTLPQLLRPGGLYSFFNGMCPFNVFFQGVACAVVQLELQALGLTTSFEQIEIATPQKGDAAWEGVTRQYFHADTYYLPAAVFDGGEGGGAADSAMPPGVSEPSCSLGGAAAQLIALNQGAVHLMGRSIAESFFATDPMEGEGDRLEGLKSLLSDHVLSHFDDAGWAFRLPLQALWEAATALAQSPPKVQLPAGFLESSLPTRAEYEGSLKLDPIDRVVVEGRAVTAARLGRAAAAATQGIDANSRIVVFEAVTVCQGMMRSAYATEGHLQKEDVNLELAILTNPLAGGDDTAPHSEVLAESDGGRDSEHHTFSNVAEVFGDAAPGEGVEWYATSRAYWQQVASDVDGMLGGLGQLHGPDVAASLAFLDALRSPSVSNPPLPNGPALDCGAGIGRVSASVLLERFTCVEILESSVDFLATARANLPVDRVRAVHAMGLEEFTKSHEPAAGPTYAAVWVQWVLLYLTDADLVDFLRRCTTTLLPLGRVIVKESVSNAARGFYVDRTDASITRTDAHFRRLFAEAGLRVAYEEMQPGMPVGVYPVCMWSLAPQSSS